MRRLLAASLCAALGCGFHPSGLIADEDAGGDAVASDGTPSDGVTAVDGPVIDAQAADAALTDARSIDAIVPMCPTGYGALGTSTSRYREVTATASWTAAAADCNDDDDGGAFTGFTHLVVIGDDAERLALTSPPAITGNSWVGLSDQLIEGTFRWVTAEPTNGYPQVGQQPPWDNGDPDGGDPIDCVRFKNSFTYEDKACTDANSYLCECDAFPPL